MCHAHSLDAVRSFAKEMLLGRVDALGAGRGVAGVAVQDGFSQIGRPPAAIDSAGDMRYEIGHRRR